MSASASYKASDVYPLSFPKGIKHLCELCQKPAHKICEKCRVTYYWYFLVCFKSLFINLKNSNIKNNKITIC